eukprot:TRINITY_DN112_c7_g1_i1.p1 TRINITY_DN112_c7_g1~~TRINITY_DN112_c7_g1_i1.p1  ORF type:complete len:167 (+),score=17.15 TRINITY_DN112_c7_g1_i1:57-503(+)
MVGLVSVRKWRMDCSVPSQGRSLGSRNVSSVGSGRRASDPYVSFDKAWGECRESCPSPPRHRRDVQRKQLTGFKNSFSTGKLSSIVQRGRRKTPPCVRRAPSKHTRRPGVNRCGKTNEKQIAANDASPTNIPVGKAKSAPPPPSRRLK